MNFGLSLCRLVCCLSPVFMYLPGTTPSYNRLVFWCINPRLWRREWDSNPRVLDGHQLTRKPMISRLTPFRVDDLPNFGYPGPDLYQLPFNFILWMFLLFLIKRIHSVFHRSRFEEGEFANVIVKSFRL